MQSSKDLLSEVYSKIKNKAIIDEEFVNFIDSIFPDKSPNILKVIKRGITKYTFKPSGKIVWTAMGQNNEYLIYPKYISYLSVTYHTTPNPHCPLFFIVFTSCKNCTYYTSLL